MLSFFFLLFQADVLQDMEEEIDAGISGDPLFSRVIQCGALPLLRVSEEQGDLTRYHQQLRMRHRSCVPHYLHDLRN